MHAASRVRPFRATLERVAVFIVLAALWEWAVDIFAIKPYLLPLDAFIQASVIDGDLNRTTGVLVVK